MEKKQVGKGGQGWGLVGLPMDSPTSEDLKEVSSRPRGHLGKGPWQREGAASAEACSGCTPLPFLCAKWKPLDLELRKAMP